MRSVRRILVVPLLLVLAAAGHSGATAVPAPGAGLDLDALLTRAVFPEGGVVQACAVEVTLPGVPALTAACDAQQVGAPQAEAAGDAADLALEVRDEMRTARWGAALAHMSGGRLARVHGYGDVAVHGADGEVAWARSGWSLYDDWGIDPWIVPFVLLGSSPLDPFVVTSERPYAVGDLTGDGVDDVAVGHMLILQPPVGGLQIHSMVTVLDGRDGTTRWTRAYPGYVTQLVVADDGLLVVGNETGNRRSTGSGQIGEDGTTTVLRALSFQGGAVGLEAAEAWSVDTGTAWARLLSAEPTGPGRLAVAWTSKPLGAAGTAGRVLLLESATGDVVWDVPTSGYPRTLRHDAVRDQVVVLEQGDQQADLDGRRSYAVTALSADTGTVAAQLQRTGAAAVSFEVLDVAGGPEPEWVTGDLQQLPATPAGAAAGTYQAMRVMAADGASAATLWSHEVQMPSEYLTGRGGGLASWPVPYALLAGGAAGERRVLVATFHARGGDGLRALRGDDGDMVWERFGNVTYPLFLLPGSVGGEDTALAVSRNQVLRAYRVADGSAALDVPLLGDLYAVQPFDADGDGTTDVLVGGESGAVFALDGAALGDDPGVLWRTTVGSGVRKMEFADLTGDGSEELVVAATSGVAAIDPRTGEMLWRRDLPGRFTWTFAVGDLDGEPGQDVVVPERGLAGIRGHDGALLWDHVPEPDRYFSEASVTPEGQVVAQSLVRFPDPLAPRHHQLVTALDARSGDVLWEEALADQGAIVRLWRSTTLAGPTADGQGTRVAVTWDAKRVPGLGTPWGPRTDLYDARTGELLDVYGPLPAGVVHMGTMYFPDRGLFEWNWQTVQHLEPQELEVVWGSTSDIGWAYLGEHGEVFVRMQHGVLVHGADSPMASEGTDHPPALARWHGLFSGRMAIADMDGDGSDEILAVPFDWPGFAQVSAFSGTAVLQADYLPHGLAVIEAR